jgi:inorganic triphosphatase YgiF
MAGAPAAGHPPSIEVERKYDVEAGTPLPDWQGLPGVVSVDEVELRELDARYLDTADLTLGRAGVALRRTGRRVARQDHGA